MRWTARPSAASPPPSSSPLFAPEAPPRARSNPLGSNPLGPRGGENLRSGALYVWMGGIERTASLNHAIGGLAKRQHGVVSRRQLRELGIGDSTITARMASGYLHPLFREAFAVGHPAITRRGRMLAAVL